MGFGTGAGSVFDPGAGGGSAVSPPSGSLKVCVLVARAFMPDVPLTLAIIALDVASVTPPGLRLVISGQTTISGVALTLGSLATGTIALPVSSLLLMRPLLQGFLVCFGPP